MSNKSYGQIAFEAYCIAVKGRDVRGGTIPEWDSLSDVVREAWNAGVDAVIRDIAKHPQAFAEYTS